MRDNIPSMTAEELKECSSCSQAKPLAEFGIDRRKEDGLSNVCKSCRQERNLKYKEENPVRYLCTMMLTSAKRRNKHPVHPDLTLDHLLEVATPNCPILGEPLLWTFQHGKGLNALSPSLDRINPLLGYEPGNIRIISLRANTLKNNLTLEQIDNLHRYMHGDGLPQVAGVFDSSVTAPNKTSSAAEKYSESIDQIFQLRDSGMTIRAIGAALGIPKSSVAVILQSESDRST